MSFTRLDTKLKDMLLSPNLYHHLRILWDSQAMPQLPTRPNVPTPVVKENTNQHRIVSRKPRCENKELQLLESDPRNNVHRLQLLEQKLASVRHLDGGHMLVCVVNWRHGLLCFAIPPSHESRARIDMRGENVRRYHQPLQQQVTARYQRGRLLRDAQTTAITTTHVKTHFSWQGLCIRCCIAQGSGQQWMEG